MTLPVGVYEDSDIGARGEGVIAARIEEARRRGFSAAPLMFMGRDDSMVIVPTDNRDVPPLIEVRCGGHSYTLWFWGGQLHARSCEDGQSLPAAGRLLELFERLPLMPVNRRFYGYVESGVVTTIFSVFGVKDGQYLKSVVAALYTLEGHEPPHELLTTPEDLKDEMLVKWAERVWRMIDEGRLVSVSEQIQERTGESWGVFDGEDTYVEFDAPAEGSPQLVTGTRYWAIDFTGRDDMTATNGPRRNPLRDWVA